MENSLEEKCAETIPVCCGQYMERDTFNECVGENKWRMGIYEEQVRYRCGKCGNATEWKTVGTHLGN
jgi:hypothetical protein